MRPIDEMNEDAPKLDYETPEKPQATSPTNFAGCLVPLSIAIVLIAARLYARGGEYSRRVRVEVQLRAVLIALLGIAVFILWLFLRRRRR